MGADPGRRRLVRLSGLVHDRQRRDDRDRRHRRRFPSSGPRRRTRPDGARRELHGRERRVLTRLDARRQRSRDARRRDRGCRDEQRRRRRRDGVRRAGHPRKGPGLDRVRHLCRDRERDPLGGTARCSGDQPQPRRQRLLPDALRRRHGGDRRRRDRRRVCRQRVDVGRQLSRGMRRRGRRRRDRFLGQAGVLLELRQPGRVPLGAGRLDLLDVPERVVRQHVRARRWPRRS